MRRTILLPVTFAAVRRPRAGRLQRLRESRRRQEGLARRIQDRLPFAAHHAAQRRASSAAAGRAPAAGDHAFRPGQGGAVAGHGRPGAGTGKGPAAGAPGDSSEQSLIAKAGAGGVDPNIRSQVNRDTRTLAEKDNTFIDSLIFWQDKPTPGVVVDPEKEQQRLRDAQATGQPSNAADADHRAPQARPARRHLLRPGCIHAPPRCCSAACFAGALLTPRACRALASLLRVDRRPSETFTLPNGLQVVVLPSSRAPIVTQVLVYKVGSADETYGQTGIAHFLEHMMFKGTGTLAPTEFSRTVARNGGRDNAFTDFDMTGYHQTIARRPARAGDAHGSRPHGQPAHPRRRS